MAQIIQFKRGLEANRLAVTPAQGEPLWTTDGKKLFMGDGSTAGGIDFVSSITADYILTSEKGIANGVASLDANAKIPQAQLPALAVTDTFVVASEAAMLALTAQTGDVAIRTDLEKSYILQGTDASVLADWQELLSPSQSVQSVNGKTGTVILTTTDIAEGTNLYFTDTRADARANAQIDSRINDTTSSSTGLYSSTKIEALVLAASGAVDSVNGQTGVVVLDTDDVAEGTTNLYYTQTRADARVQAAINDAGPAAADEIYSSTKVEALITAIPAAPVTSVNGQTGVVVLDSDDTAEGTTNLFFTDTRADARIAAASIDDLDDVDTSTNTPTSGQVLEWDGTNWVPKTAAVGITDFTDLGDTPANYTGSASKLVAVNAAGTDLVFTNIIDGGLF